MLGQDGSSGDGYGAAAVLLFVVLAGLYFLPTIIAAGRKVPNAGSVFVLNLFLGWSLIGWVVALAMAARSVPQTHNQNVYVRQPFAPPAPPTRSDPGGVTAPSSTSFTFTHSGSRYLFGYTIDPPAYAIWDRQRPGPPIERFPYSPHGKDEAFSRYQTLEPNAIEGNPGAASTPPMPG